MKKPEVGIPSTENSEHLENPSELRYNRRESHSQLQKNEAEETPKPVEDNNKESGSTEEKLMKKPDKIQQCPRCNSMDTKFCYFNNYNVNQPRHFCKNCQRYWTAGGTMRNVPVGAGRRRNKQHLSSQFHHHHRHIIVSPEGISMPPTPTTLESSSPDGNTTTTTTLLKFGPDSSDSIANVGAENGEEASLCGSSVTNNNNNNELSNELNTNNNTSSGGVVQCYAVPPWGFPMQWYPLQFVAPPFWNGAVSPSSSTTSNSCCSANNNVASPILGKHSRDAVFNDEEKSADKCVLVPKTLRI